MKDQLRFGSTCVKDPVENRTTKPHTLPIYATSSFNFETIEQSEAVFRGQSPGHIYGRFGNPTIDAVNTKIARLETHGLDVEAEAILVSSGMSAISTLILATLKKGQSILTQENIYGGTTDLFRKVLEPLGIGIHIADLSDPNEVEQALKNNPDVGMIYFETPANPTLACIDMLALADLAGKYNCLTAVDNTFATPYLQQPFAYGIDYIIHSTTKYLNGHGNSVAGIIIGTDVEYMRSEMFTAMKLVGTNSNAWDAWLINNGLKTLEIRMDRHCDNAIRVAHYLEDHPSVDRVNYTGLLSHPDHELAKRQMRNFGGMLSFELKGGLAAGKSFMNRLQFCSLAPTLGDVDTLVVHPATMSHINVPPEVRAKHGITDGLIRISVGIESVEDIIADLDQAMKR